MVSVILQKRWLAVPEEQEKCVTEGQGRSDSPQGAPHSVRAIQQLSDMDSLSELSFCKSVCARLSRLQLELPLCPETYCLKVPSPQRARLPCGNDLGRCTVTFSLTKRAQGGKVGFDSWKRRHAADFHKLFSSCYLIWWMLKGSWAKTNYTPQNLRSQESKLKQRNFGKPLMDRQAFWLVYESANMKEEETWTLIITIYKRNFV